MRSEIERGLHVAIIMDGNGRWAERRGLPRVAGHRAGVAAVRRTVEHAPEVGVGCLTLYAFSADNWRRPPMEVQSIFWLLRAYLRIEQQRLREAGVRLQAIGRRDRLPSALLQAIEQTERATATGNNLLLRVAIDYSSRAAIARAALDAPRLVEQERAFSMEAMQRVVTHALTVECSDVDLLIRTGGEKRLSDFVLWEAAYAELHFTERMWPDFGAADLDAALEEFRRRERRFGGVPAAKNERKGPTFVPPELKKRPEAPGPTAAATSE